MKNLQRSEIKLSNGKTIVIIHNLPDFGLSIDAALDNWLARTKKFTAGDFCEYIVSKDPLNIFAVTEERFKELSK